MKMLVANFFKALCRVVNIFLTIFTFVFSMRLILAWIGPDYTFELIGFLTESGVNLVGKIFHLPVLEYDIRPVFTIAILLFLKFFTIRSFSDLSKKMEN